MSVRNRLVVVALLASFVLPFWLGALAYQRGWFVGGQTNKGELITPPARLADTPRPARWQLVHVAPAACDAACQLARDTLHRLHATLGRDRERVSFRTVGTDAGLHAGYWYIADPMGWVMLRYPAPVSAPDALRRAQDLLDDLHKLLKVSRIG